MCSVAGKRACRHKSFANEAFRTPFANETVCTWDFSTQSCLTWASESHVHARGPTGIIISCHICRVRTRRRGCKCVRALGVCMFATLFEHVVFECVRNCS